MKYKFGYLNEEYDERLEQLELEYLDLYHKSMSEYTKKDWTRFDEYNKKQNELISVILKERKEQERKEFINIKKKKK